MIQTPTKHQCISPSSHSSGSSKSCTPSSVVVAVSTAHQLYPLLPGSIPPESRSYFHGKITREHAEDLLTHQGAMEGLFLLRESVNRNYVISICHSNKLHHYNVERQTDGSYRIQGGHRFVGPIELVQHHSRQLDGFLTLARLPLNRPEGSRPLLIQGLPIDELEDKLRLKAAEMGLKGRSVEEALNGPMRNHLRLLVLKDFHLCQPWYHHAIRRREAERRLIENGNREGAYLVRFRKEDETFVLSLSSQKEPKHYKIENHLDRLSIEGGQYFETLVEMIDHYHHRQDGLLCKLRHAVVAPNFTRSRSGTTTTTDVLSSKCKTNTEEIAVQTNITAGAINGWNGSQSLPSLCAVVPLLPEGLEEDTSQITSESTKQDLISFADWPNVNKLLSTNQNEGHQSQVPATSFPTTLPNALQLQCLDSTNRSTKQFPIQFTPATPIGNPFADITPTPMAVCQPQWINQTVGVGNWGDQNNNTNHVANMNNSMCAGHDARRRRRFDSIGSARTVNHARTASVPANESKCLHPIRFNDASLNRMTAEIDATIANLFTNALTPPNLSASRSPGHSANLTNSSNKQRMWKDSVPLATLHFSPILDMPWEEPEGSDHLSSSASEAQTEFTQLDVCPTTGHTVRCCSITTNPFLSMSTSQFSRHSSLPTASDIFSSTSLSHAPDVTTFCSNACCQRKNLPLPTSPNSRLSWIKHMCETDSQLIYDELPPSNFLLNSACVLLGERLGGGNFGHVVRGVYITPDEGREVPVAVKTLKPDQIANAGEREILAEARTMAQLKHRHIVRLIGVCKEEQFMLVLELAPLGPINRYLKKRLDTPVLTLTELMYQVSLGMAYLESCKFVHRDLAARNVLLVTQHFAKISDFGMSKALKFGSDYYRAATAGKWPLKWYAPECIYYFRFDSKSDVWSFGITLWEVYSYGERPYRDMKGAQILSMLDQGLRLPKPARCPDTIYNIMQQCWNFEGIHRPTFAELVLTLSRLVKLMPPSPRDAAAVGGINRQGSSSLAASASSGGSGVNSGASDAASF